jgi:NADH-quinone oxidoreductase subunit H
VFRGDWLNILFGNDAIGIGLRILIYLAVFFGGYVYIIIWAERRGSAMIQLRRGPNRVGPLGLLQSMADGIKFFFKEDFIPARAHKALFVLAPIFALVPAIVAFAPIPYGFKKIGSAYVPLAIADLNLGLVYVLAVTSLSVYSILIAGWSSNNKWSLLGGIRASSQMISYEVPLTLAVAGVFVLAGSARLSDIVEAQQSLWFCFPAFIGFLVFIVSMFAETNRIPFDLPEGESEIVGYHVEYSSMKFALFFMSEYLNILTSVCVLVLAFLGGWEFLPFFGWEKVGHLLGVSIFESKYLWIVPSLWFGAKVVFFLFFFIWVRWTLPRFRYDQLMGLGWKKLLPLSLVNLFVVAILAYIYNR